MFERFTDRARHVLVLAQEEARLLNHNFIGTEHLLLGLIHERDGLAAQALSAAGVTLESVRAAVEEILSGVTSLDTGSPPFTPRAKKVLEYSLRQALQLDHAYIGTEHLLLGLLREGEGVGCRVLVGLEVDLEQLRYTVLQMLDDSPGAPDLTDPSDPSGRPIRSTFVGRTPGAIQREGDEQLRREIEAALTTDPSSQLLRRYLAGEVSEADLGEGSVTRALAETAVHLQELLLKMTQRFLPPSTSPST
ncbi:MAG TPA: Clp protease N-terminal domain-containing protein [Acidimicrobiales bacterium]|jgi:ATP-dependent Clp protease ATP-binding subunit ClpA|nr:Clp protease N-terminal domain-containing protein [Acidimicrobiales bacterium]